MHIFWQVVLIVGCVAIVAGVIISRVIARKKGKTGCDCGCGCSHCSGCSIPGKEDKKE